jgi:general secretion pathway protein J
MTIRASRGFTLLELLVVMTLLSLLMTGMISAMRTMAQTESRIDQRFARMDELRTAYAFLSQAISRQSAAKTALPDTPGESRSLFTATPGSMTWVGVLPARPNVGGLHFFQLTTETTDTGDLLVLRLVPCDPDFTPPDWSAAERHVLATHITKLDIQAQGSAPRGYPQEKNWPQGWQSGWPIADVLPQQVRLSLQGPKVADVWSWTIAIHALPRTDDTISIVTFGGVLR